MKTSVFMHPVFLYSVGPEHSVQTVVHSSFTGFKSTLGLHTAVQQLTEHSETPFRFAGNGSTQSLQPHKSNINMCFDHMEALKCFRKLLYNKYLCGIFEDFEQSVLLSA